MFHFVKHVLFVLLVFCIFASSFAFAADSSGAHWGYSGSAGPAHWGDLSDKYAICKSGKNQSPINITSAVEANLSQLNFHYEDSEIHIVNNGHTVQVNYDSGSYMKVDGHRYDLKQFHFHTPSENQINGKPFPLEVHLVHADSNGKLAVVGVMFKIGPENAFLGKFWNDMPATGGGHFDSTTTTINAADLLPKDGGYYRFNGSLTTPPCSEGVSWFVMKASQTVSSAQVSSFLAAVGEHNSRPVQPVFARVPLQ